MEKIEFGSMNDMEELVKEMENGEKSAKSTSLYWAPKNEGVTAIRFLPNIENWGEKLFYQKRKVHYVNGRSYYCLAQTLKDKDGNIHEDELCPFCQKSKQLYSTSERGTDDWALAGDLRAKDRYVARVVVRGKTNDKKENTEAVPEFYEFGKKIYEMIFNAIKINECGNVFSLKEGRDFNLSKKGTGKNTDYSGSGFSMKTSPIFSEKEKIQTLMNTLPEMDYSKLVSFETQESLNRVLKEYLNESNDNEIASVANTVINTVEDDIMSKPAAQEDDDDIDALLAGL